MGMMIKDRYRLPQQNKKCRSTILSFGICVVLIRKVNKNNTTEASKTNIESKCKFFLLTISFSKQAFMKFKVLIKNEWNYKTSVIRYECLPGSYYIRMWCRQNSFRWIALLTQNLKTASVPHLFNLSSSLSLLGTNLTAWWNNASTWTLRSIAIFSFGSRTTRSFLVNVKTILLSCVLQVESSPAH